MNKKIWIIISVLLIAIVTYWVTAEKDTSDIVAAKEKLLTNLAREKEDKKQNLQKSQPAKYDSPSLTQTPNDEPVPNSLMDDNLPKETKVVPVKTDKANPAVSKKRANQRNRIFPPKEVLPESASAVEKTGDSGSAIRGGGGGSTVITGSPRIFVVTETGEGEAYLLMEAIRILNPGDKIQLKKGSYSLLIGHLSVPDFEIDGEGPETLLELPETLKLQQQNLTFRNLKLANTSSGALVEIRNEKKLTLQNVELQGNGNDCVEITKGQIVANDLEVQRCNRAVFLKANSTVQISGLNISDSDYGIFMEGDKAQTITNLKTENINLYSIFFASGSSGNVTCISCTLTDNATNRKARLILKSAP